MELNQIITLLIGTGTIVLIYWFFFGKKDEMAVESTSSVISIKVDAGYSPSAIQVKKGKPVTLNILRTDPSDCLDQLVIPQWHIIKALPLNKEIKITFTPDEIGEFPFHCGMNMFHGKIIVKE